MIHAPRRFALAVSVFAAVSVLSACEQHEPRNGATGTLVFDPAAVYGSKDASPNEDRAKTFLATQAEVLRSDAIRDRVARRLMLSEPERKALASSLSVDRRGDALVLAVGVDDRDPNKAVTLCNEVMEAYLDDLRERDQQMDANRAEYLAEQEDELRARDAGADADVVRKIRIELGAKTEVRPLPAHVLDACKPGR